MTTAQIIFSILSLNAENISVIEDNIFVRLTNGFCNQKQPIHGKTDAQTFKAKLESLTKRGLVTASDDMWPVYSVTSETLEMICSILNDELEGR